MLAPSTAMARLTVDNPGRTYVEARAAAMNGNHARAAELLAMLAAAQPGEIDIAKKALSEAIGAGQMDLAINLTRSVPPTKLPTDARLLLVAHEIRQRRPDRAIPWLTVSADNGDLSFLSPLIRAWDAAERGNGDQAVATIERLPANNLLAPLRAEQQAFLLLKFRRTAEAEPFARRAIGAAGSRETRLRLAFADGFLAAGDKQRALVMIEGMGSGEVAARQQIERGKLSGQGVDTLSEALSEVLTAFSADLARMQRSAPPIGLVQVARFANPKNSSATALLALLLAGRNRSDEALALLRAVPANDALISHIRDVHVRILIDAKQVDQAWRVASGPAAAAGAEVADHSRLGDVLIAMKRPGEAASAYGRAIASARAHNLNAELWSLLLLQASALEQADRWPEARQALQQGLMIAPEQPLLLNFLGYAKLERQEDLDSAEAMIRKASELAPDDASITDSLGWALFKRGKADEAIATLQRAAEKDPEQAEIQEHLGDALYTSGRRYQARFAWTAALVTAEDEIAQRVKAKLENGLTPANAAP